MIEINGLKFSYGKQTVLDNITMKLEPGRIYGLLGENGVGKTTLLTLLSGLKKPQEGGILIDGKKPWKRDPSMLEEIIYLPDEVAPIRQTAAVFARVNGAFRTAGLSMKLIRRTVVSPLRISCAIGLAGSRLQFLSLSAKNARPSARSPTQI